MYGGLQVFDNIVNFFERVIDGIELAINQLVETISSFFEAMQLINELRQLFTVGDNGFLQYLPDVLVISTGFVVAAAILNYILGRIGQS